MTENRRVSYFYDSEVGNYHYGQGKQCAVSSLDVRLHVRYGVAKSRGEQCSRQSFDLFVF